MGFWPICLYNATIHSTIADGIANCEGLKQTVGNTCFVDGFSTTYESYTYFFLGSSMLFYAIDVGRFRTLGAKV